MLPAGSQMPGACRKQHSSEFGGQSSRGITEEAGDTAAWPAGGCSHVCFIMSQLTNHNCVVIGSEEGTSLVSGMRARRNHLEGMLQSGQCTQEQHCVEASITEGLL